MLTPTLTAEGGPSYHCLAGMVQGLGLPPTFVMNTQDAGHEFSQDRGRGGVNGEGGGRVQDPTS